MSDNLYILDARTLRFIIGILERTIRKVSNAGEGLPKYSYHSARKEHFNGQIEALEEVVKMLKRILEEQE